jgi:DNA-binding MarR family transcriptional regulator
MLLLNFVRLGDYASLRLADALKASGLNLTQAMICRHLFTIEKGRHTLPVGVTLTELTAVLHMPQTRLHNQVTALKRRKLIKPVPDPDEQDRRQKFYRLTAEGKRLTAVFLAAAATADKAVEAEMREILIPRRVKEKERWFGIRQQFLKDHLGSF